MLTPNAGGGTHLHCSPSLADRRLFLRRTSSARTRHRSPDMCTIGDVFRLLLVSGMDVLLINNMVNSFSSFHSLFLFFIFCNLVERTFAIRFAACRIIRNSPASGPLMIFHERSHFATRQLELSTPTGISIPSHRLVLRALEAEECLSAFKVSLHFSYIRS